MVYEFVNTGYAFPPDIFAGIFSRDFTHPLLAAISVTAVAVFWLNLSRDPTATARSPLEPQAIWANPILVVGLSFVVLFLHFATDYAVSDEVMINLEHSYNLHHFGRFSMSPSAMVDGTVEYLFYLASRAVRRDRAVAAFRQLLHIVSGLRSGAGNVLLAFADPGRRASRADGADRSAVSASGAAARDRLRQRSDRRALPRRSADTLASALENGGDAQRADALGAARWADVVAAPCRRCRAQRRPATTLATSLCGERLGASGSSRCRRW